MATSGAPARSAAGRVSEPVRKFPHISFPYQQRWGYFIHIRTAALKKQQDSLRSVVTDDEKSCMLLVMRVLSIVPLNFKVSLRYHLVYPAESSVVIDHAIIDVELRRLIIFFSLVTTITCLQGWSSTFFLFCSLFFIMSGINALKGG